MVGKGLSQVVWGGKGGKGAWEVVVFSLSLSRKLASRMLYLSIYELRAHSFPMEERK